MYAWGTNILTILINYVFEWIEAAITMLALNTICRKSEGESDVYKIM
jgi:hypothetical protein